MNTSWEKGERAIVEPILGRFAPMIGKHEVSKKVGLFNFFPVYYPQNIVPNSEKKLIDSFWDKVVGLLKAKKHILMFLINYVLHRKKRKRFMLPR